MSIPILGRLDRPAIALIRACLLALLTLVALLSAQAQSPALPPSPRIQAAGKLTVAVFFEDVVPFFYVGPDGKLVGVDPAIAEDIAAKLGVTLEYNRAATTFDGLIDEVVRRSRRHGDQPPQRYARPRRARQLLAELWPASASSC